MANELYCLLGLAFQLSAHLEEAVVAEWVEYWTYSFIYLFIFFYI